MSAASLYRSKTRHVLPDLRVRGVGLRGSVVLADHAAEYFPALHGCIERQDDLRVVVGRPLLAGLVRAVAVGVAGVSSGHRPQVPFVVDQRRVGALGPYGAHPPLGMAVCSWRPR